VPKEKEEMHLLTEKTLRFKERMDGVHKELYELMAEIDSAAKERVIRPEPDMVDIGFLCRETETVFDEMRKEVKARKELLGKIISVWHTEGVMKGEITKESAQGILATGSPDVSQQPKIPKRGTPEFLALMKFLGVSEELSSGERPPIQFDWNGMGVLMGERARQGLPVPPGITKMYPVFTTVFRGRKTKESEKVTENSPF